MKLSYSCRRAGELLSKRLDEPLGLIEELKLRLHLSMCGNCGHVASQLGAISTACAELFSGEPDASAPAQLLADEDPSIDGPASER